MAKGLGVLAAALMAWGSAAQADEDGRWQQLGNDPNCFVWNANPLSIETVIWSGTCENQRAQGRGAVVWHYLEDEQWKVTVYEGELKDGKRHGRGVYLWADGNRYEGDWKDGKAHGHGVVVWVNGDRYEGDWKDDKWYGHGVWVGANGDSCEGEWREGSLLGTGKGMENVQFRKCYDDGCAITFVD